MCRAGCHASEASMSFHDLSGSRYFSAATLQRRLAAMTLLLTVHEETPHLLHSVKGRLRVSKRYGQLLATTRNVADASLAMHWVVFCL